MCNFRTLEGGLVGFKTETLNKGLWQGGRGVSKARRARVRVVVAASVAYVVGAITRLAGRVRTRVTAFSRSLTARCAVFRVALSPGRAQRLGRSTAAVLALELGGPRVRAWLL